jgi:U4/U6 small nuclear ribonucleoprotein PRP3
VNELAHPAHKFKVEMNAKQLKLTGTVILSKDVNVVVVEGGPKQQRFFQHLMLRRIKWNHEKKSAANQTDKIEPGTATAGDDTKDATAAATSKPRNECVLVWEGIVKRRAFGDVKFKQCQLAKEARELFIKHGVPQYWDMALTTNILKDELQTEL